MTTLNELWKKAVSKNKPQIKNKDYLPIIVSSVVSAGASYFINKVDLAKASFTKIFLIDFVIILSVISGIIFVIIIY